MATDVLRRGIYNVEYFSGSQAAIYIGDVWIDEVTSIGYSVQQSRIPLYGYADSLYRDVAKGQVLVQGSFTINFKEAGYLWLALNWVKNKAGQATPLYGDPKASVVERRNLERLIDGETDTIAQRNEMLSTLAARASLTGFSSVQRFSGTSIKDEFRDAEREAQGTLLGRAEDAFEAFEDVLWGPADSKVDSLSSRRADDPALQGFDIYMLFGDFAGDNRNNHTIQKITDVHSIGSAKQVVIDGQPIQEEYTFIGRNLV